MLLLDSGSILQLAGSSDLRVAIKALLEERVCVLKTKKKATVSLIGKRQITSSLNQVDSH
jgi:hypothetical protein